MSCGGGADLTAAWTGEGPAAVFIAVDHCSAECVGRRPRHALRGAGTDPPGRAPAFRRLRQGHRQRSRRATRPWLAIHIGPLSEGAGIPWRREFASLGPCARPEGNGCAERFIRTLKENLLWVRTFETIEELRQALLEFRETYNATWLIERHGSISPTDFRQQQLQPAAKAA